MSNNLAKLAVKTHRLIGSDGVQIGSVVIVANLREHVRQVTAVDHELRIHKSLKVKQVSYDVDGWGNIQEISKLIIYKTSYMQDV